MKRLFLFLCFLSISGLDQDAYLNAASSRPNIVLVMADDLGWGDIGYHGGEAPTPNLDRVSAAGLRFNRFYAQPICTPTRTALMTGRYPWRSGMASGVVLNHLSYGLPIDEVTLADVLKSAGYKNYLVGKWHLGHSQPAYLPTERGFDYHYGLYTAIDHFTHTWQGGHDWHRNRQPVYEEGYATDLLGDDAVRIIHEHDYDSGPMFLYHAMFAVHPWMQSTEDYMAPFSDEANEERRGLLGLVSAMDYQFGRMIDALKAEGQLDNTIVFFLSDNGGPVNHQASNGKLRGTKGTYYEGGVRVPAFAYWPGRIAAGETSEALAYVADLFATSAALAGAELPQDRMIDGLDLSPVLFGQTDTSFRREIVFMLEDSERLRRGAIIHWPWKMRRTALEGQHWVYELFNLEIDPNEAGNAHRLGQLKPEIVSWLSARLDMLAVDAPKAYWRPGDGNPPSGWQADAIIGPDQ
ncbi:arylsulfatase [Coraliomargarita sp. SDUM461004]|uniref:Arylsulfatase n=1 Tax=Thalassobacterium sedimentorum TaxID=3041258 RepID=A0ABU1AII8_9BACT|nr:arylsulfatase [Coraliomargarita sp. SDUM461004]MDQ8193690.1 arylsulfatase [Coraliomargarita sp. SDUM461004]